MITLPFSSRTAAALQLSRALRHLRGTRPLVLAIPCGAVPMGRVVADALQGELDVVLVEKIGTPANPEIAIGSVDEHGRVKLNKIAGWLDVPASHVRAEADRLAAMLRARGEIYRRRRPGIRATDRVVIVVDDGLATSVTMEAALRAVRSQRPKWLVSATPVAAPDALADIEALADETVYLAAPVPFVAVGRYYLDVADADDRRVVAALARPKDPEPSESRAFG